jgi:carbonic anhydrase
MREPITTMFAPLSRSGTQPCRIVSIDEETTMKTVDVIYRYAAQDLSPRPQPSDSDAALLRLNDGNRDFALLLDHVHDDTGVIQQIIPVDPRDLGLASGVTGPTKQRPFAVVVGCSDARAPIELIFNEGPNDLFVVRVAGNGLGMDVLGSVKYAFASRHVHLQN